MKWCGKSAPRAEQFAWQGKPHAEQDQIGEEERPAPMNSRVGRLSPSEMAGLEEWLPPASAGTETGLQIAQDYFLHPYIAATIPRLISIEWLPPASSGHRNRLTDRAGLLPPPLLR